jgi:oxalate decarboxylase
MTTSVHVRALRSAEPVHASDLGAIRGVDAKNFPILKRMSMQHLELAAGAIREPHWRANANALAYCIEGKLQVSILDNADVFAAFTIVPGQMFHVNVGSLQSIENIGDGPAELIIVSSDALPEEFSLHAAFGAMSDAVLGNTYDLPASAFEPLVRDTTSAKIVKRDGPPVVSERAGFLDPHKFDLEGMSPPVHYPYGEARTARAQFWPALKDLCMYAIRIKDSGMREPHWHPNTAEMGYVHQGHARMTILDPDGSTDTYLLAPGDCYFIPRSYPHQIEVLSDEDIHFLVFFDQTTPGDVGYRAAVSTFTSEVLAATFGVEQSKLPEFPFTPIDPLIVAKSNPLDPVA